VRKNSRLVKIAILIFLSSLFILLRPAPYISLPEFSIKPGDSLPSDADCYFYYYPPGGAYCHVRRGNLDIYLSLDTIHSKIEHVAYLLNSDYLRIGDLVLAWGLPTGQYRSKWGQMIYFSTDRYAYIPGPEFRPASIVRLIVFGKNEIRIERWRGFHSYGKM
jgi:hypothetical protein